MGVKKSIDLIEIDIWIGGGRKSETYWGVWVYEWGRGRIYRGGRIGTRGRITTIDGIGSIGRIVIIASNKTYIFGFKSKGTAFCKIFISCLCSIVGYKDNFLA